MMKIITFNTQMNFFISGVSQMLLQQTAWDLPNLFVIIHYNIKGVVYTLNMNL